MEVFYINICGFISRDKFYMRPEYLTIAISDIKFSCPPLIAGGIKVTLRGSSTPRRPLAEKYIYT